MTSKIGVEGLSGKTLEILISIHQRYYEGIVFV
jgi:hypothetical protein